MKLVTHFWHLTNLMQFDNIAFGKTIGISKYLTCADCEQDIIGVQWMDEGNNYYLIQSKVHYDESFAKKQLKDMPRSFNIPENFIESLKIQQEQQKIQEIEEEK
eukprot:TRINITY_DN2857_c0_g2_i2.p1 TRINITY_DN2857_c0_g2~~TRINITY_DN2857_c0_g2_i2.p1  ORF type:complete len:104 (+),score=31.22 TRINITY_DN2857_c0_g2_i2:146-457(+)